MTAEHGQTARKLMRQLALQLSEATFLVDRESPKLRVPGGNYRIPDVCVIPVPVIQRRLREEPRTLEVYDDPMPLVVEVWSPSTGDMDIEQKLLEYQARGDLEIWRLHPYERTLTVWRRQPDGSYVETLHAGRVLQPITLPDVTVQIDQLFD